MKIAGLDIGTTGCKCTVFGENGECLGRAYRNYPAKCGAGRHEADAGTLMEAAFAVLRDMALQYPDIAGVGVTSFGETFVVTDSAGVPLHAALLYTDPRGRGECAELCAEFGAERIAAVTGLRPHEMYSLPKLMWLARHEPELWRQKAFIFLMEDFVVYHLCGQRRIDYSLASRTMAFDIKDLCWSRRLLYFAGVPEEQLSRPVPSGTAVGCITPETAMKTGLRPDTQIICGGHDQIAAAVGAGAFDSGTAVDGAGTVECLTPIFDSLPDTARLYEGFFSVVPYVVPGKYAAYAFSYTGGALIQWCTDTLAKKEKELAEAKGLSVNEYLEPLAESPTGLLVLPHFAGAATPYMDTGSRGAVLGLTTSTTAAQLYRACMEGVAYEMRLNAEALLKSGASFCRLNATGGGARSGVWIQMKADVLNLPLTALETADAGTVGCAMLTGVALGRYADLADAARHLVKTTKTYLPNPALHARYSELYERYRRVYGAVRPLMEDMK